MKEIKRIILDFDDVIVNTLETYCLLYNQKYCNHKDFKPADFKKCMQWDLLDECPLENNKYSIFSTREFFDRLKFFDGAIESIRELHERIPITICSVCSYNSMGSKAQFIVENLPFIKDTIFITDSGTLNKGIVDMSNCLFVDDSAKNLTLSNAKIKICFGKTNEQNIFWEGLWEKNWEGLFSTISSYI